MSKTDNTQHKPCIAIVGMGCIFPKSRNLKEYWHLLFNGIDAIEDIPDKTHWKIKDYFDPDPSTPDHVYCKRGGFLPAVSFDPLSYGIPPNNLEVTDTSQLLGLEVARMALEDAGYPLNHPALEQKKVNVILGVTGTQELVIPLGGRLGHPIWKKALKDSGIREEKREEILQRIQGDYVQWQENSFPGLLGNVVAGRIANRLNLSGTNTVTDAACASSLSAIHTAVMELVSKKCDMSITGGVDTLNDIFMHMCFAKTGVLSHTSDAKPFSKDADGTVLGEGIGMLILKRLEDAQKDNDRIYAVIKGIGTSSDGRTSAVYAPDSKGQLKALKEAYREAGFDPSTVGLVEAHGTGTRVGDKVEFEALKKCFEHTGKKNHTVIGSVKSMIGHTKAAAGAAGVIKTALSLYNKTFPPTLKALEPDPELDINNSAFYLNSEAKPWISYPAASPRRSGVSAFGFGGSNFHVVLEEYAPKKNHVSWDGAIQIIAFSSDTKEGLLDKINRFKAELDVTKDALETRQTIAWLSCESRQNFLSAHEFRLLMVHKQEDDIQKNLNLAIQSIEMGKSQPNLYFSSGKNKGKLGFLFPGQGSQYTGMGKDLVSVFPEALEAMEQAADIFSKENSTSGSKLLQDYIFPPPSHLQQKNKSAEQLRQTDIAQPAIGALSLAMIKVLKRFGITPHITCGHSFGELCALYSAGWMDEKSFLKLAAIRGKHMAAAGSLDGDSGSMLAVQAALKDIETLIKQNKLDLILANKNSKTQGVLSGSTQEILRAKKICDQRKMRAVKLDVAAAFHSKLVQNAVKPFQKDLASTAFSSTGIDVLSNTTGTSYLKKESEIKKILGNQLINPVNFVDNIENMLGQNVSVFIEAGPKAVLTGLIKPILRDKKITAVSVDQSSGKKSGIEDLAHVLCMIASKGFFVDLTQWEDAAEKPKLKKMSVQFSGANPKPKNRCNLPKSAPEPLQQKIHQESLEFKAAKTVELTNNSPQKAMQKPFIENRSAIKGSDMTTQNTQRQENYHLSSPASQAMTMVQKGFEAMQQLQTQTARTHEKFLETQAQAGKTLASMLEHTRNLAFNTPLASSVPAPVSAAVSEPAPAITEYRPDHENDPIPVSQISSHTIIAPAVEPEIQIETPQPVKTNRFTESENNTADAHNEHILFEIVSKLTGFPVEMLESDMDIESDLGIDSIKKVEIISELEKQIPSCEGLTTDNIGSVRTLKDICIAIQNEATPVIETTAVTNPVTESEPVVQVDIKHDTYTYQTVSTVLVNTISELTGFPVEMLEPSMNLESDLGIDSIKRVEILSKLEQELDHIETISSDDIATLKTIEEIIQFLTKNDPKTPLDSKIPVDSKKKTPESNYEPQKGPDNTVSDTKLTRQVVSLQEYPTNQIRFYNGSRIELPTKKKVYITQDSSTIAARFKSEFEKSGIPSVLIDIGNGNIPELPDAAGIVLVPDAFKEKNRASAMEFLKSAFELVKKNAAYLMDSATEKGAFLTTVSFLGGQFGFSGKAFNCDPAYGGVAGLAKTADLEWKNVLCRALDMPDSKEKCLENAEAAVALMMTHGAVEMGLDGDCCNIPVLVDQDLTQHGIVDLSPEDVVIITGGAKGVTAACANELAKKYSPTIVLIGRSAPPALEPEWANDLYDPAMLKKAILTHEFKGQIPKPADIEKIYQKIVSNREIQKNIELMKKNGSQVRYFSADIRNQKEIDKIFKTVRKEFKQITAIIHGAGVLEDKLIIDKQIDQFCNVLETKVKGLDSLLYASKHDKLKYLILFSSIAARTGNQGQCDYSIANEILNKTAQKLAIKNPECKFLSINWGPWEGGMVDESLKKAFLKRGIDLIPLKAGAIQLLSEMEHTQKICPEVVIGAHLLEPEKSREPKLSKAMTLSLGLTSTPVLNSHRIAGEPVVPFALLMECHAHAAQKNNPGLVFAGMDGMRLLKGIKPGTEELNVTVNLGKCKPDGNEYKTPSSITSTNDNENFFQHSNCTVILKDKLPKPPVLSKAAFMELKPYSLTITQAYREILFHGNALQGIKCINGYSKKGIEVITGLAPHPDQWFKKPLHSTWNIEPMMLDAAFQAAILWSYERMGQVCLPSFIANLRLYSSFKELKGDIRILFTVNEETKSKIKGYFTFLNEENVVVASITGFEAITDLSLNDTFKNKPLFSRDSILAFAQGNPSEAFGEKYTIFDKDRQIARLPRPPYFFMDRVLVADHPQWEIKPGGWIETQYDIPKDAWYFKANRSDTIPFCILLEIALQPCGWLAAYAGSALASDERLHFRNLGGKATLIKPLSKDCGTVTIRSRMTDVSKAGGMIIQDFDMEVLKDGNAVYKGWTNFGFFTTQTLSNQVGIRNSRFSGYLLSEQDSKAITAYEFKDDAPLTPDDKNIDKNTGMPAKALRMIDKIEVLSFDAGLYEKGYIKAIKIIDPLEWFFKAHFYQDPVCPGSLGIESFLQMIRFFLVKKFDIDPEAYDPQMTIGQSHEWIYRGQIIPLNKKIEVHAHIKDVLTGKDELSIIADGALTVDGICIYEMTDFIVGFNKIKSLKKSLKQDKVSE
ncbi:type I polyketide synthase [Desulfobacula phenolica]|uniref:Polyketide-type polyunsaturated fatty acid synthase PfaA n=1 Tax=Desulfobacula phenolica TaxID=90732 RepID=A0A1H2HL64_9BACT|nr:type I polyketide synthase [Desulfobacula phenolica]SDU32585.1 polyketide-type polyunsaturated fatty acid synthase PfaA [Desulfobacula phenolica]